MRFYKEKYGKRENPERVEKERADFYIMGKRGVHDYNNYVGIKLSRIRLRFWKEPRLRGETKYMPERKLLPSLLNKMYNGAKTAIKSSATLRNL